MQLSILYHSNGNLLIFYKYGSKGFSVCGKIFPALWRIMQCFPALGQAGISARLDRWRSICQLSKLNDSKSWNDCSKPRQGQASVHSTYRASKKKTQNISVNMFWIPTLLPTIKTYLLCSSPIPMSLALPPALLPFLKGRLYWLWADLPCHDNLVTLQKGHLSLFWYSTHGIGTYSGSSQCDSEMSMTIDYHTLS